MKRCINLDWLEVYVIEDGKHSYEPSYFRAHGYDVKERDYGTRQYTQMFTLCENGIPCYEIRRDPLSKKSQGGIMADRASHIRFVNRICYLDNPILPFMEFLTRFHYTFKNITRFDLALDFQLFDDGEKPEHFVSRYMSGEISKLHQSKLATYGIEKNKPDKTEEGWDVASHGEDAWNARKWNSLKWGAPTSAISTKLYNKTMELSREGHDKPYIRDAWDDCELNEDLPVWRIEFSVKSQKRHMVEKDSGQLLEITLEQLASRELLLFHFYSFFAEYFDFRIVDYNSKGEAVRKDRCPRLTLFYIGKDDEAYKPITLSNKQDSTRTDKLLIKRLRQIADEQELTNVNLRSACSEIISYLYMTRRNTQITHSEIEQRNVAIEEERWNQDSELKPYYDELLAQHKRTYKGEPDAVQ